MGKYADEFAAFLRKQGQTDDPLEDAFQQIQAGTRADNLENMGEAKRGLLRGWEGLKASAAGAEMLTGKALGLESLQQDGLQRYQDYNEQASLYPAGVENFTDISSPLDAGKWLVGSLGELAPSMADAVIMSTIGATAGSTVPGAGTVAGGLAGLFGKQTIKTAIKELAESAIAKGVTREVAEAGAKKAVERQAAKLLGAKVGMVAGTAQLEVGGNFGEAVEEVGMDQASVSAAVLTGGAAALLELAGGQMRIIDKVLGPNAGKALREAVDKKDLGFIARTFKEAATQAPQEFAQEAGQEALSLANLTINNPDLALFTKDNLHRTFEAGMKGAAGGGVTGGVTGMFSKPQANAPAPIQKPPAVAPIVTPPRQGSEGPVIPGLPSWKPFEEGGRSAGQFGDSIPSQPVTGLLAQARAEVAQGGGDVLDQAAASASAMTEALTVRQNLPAFSNIPALSNVQDRETVDAQFWPQDRRAQIESAPVDVEAYQQRQLPYTPAKQQDAAHYPSGPTIPLGLLATAQPAQVATAESAPVQEAPASTKREQTPKVNNPPTPLPASAPRGEVLPAAPVGQDAAVASLLAGKRKTQAFTVTDPLARLEGYVFVDDGKKIKVVKPSGSVAPASKFISNDVAKLRAAGKTAPYVAKPATNVATPATGNDISSRQVGAEISGFMREERNATSGKEKVSAWREKYSDRWEKMVSGDLAKSDYERVQEAISSGKVTQERALAMLDEGIIDGAIHKNVAGVLRSKIAAPESAKIAQSPEVVNEPTALDANHVAAAKGRAEGAVKEAAGVATANPVQGEGKQPWEMTRGEYSKDEPKGDAQWDAFKVRVGQRDITVIKNPSQQDYSEINKTFREEYPDAPKDTVRARHTIDREGNKYIWPAADATHPDVEPAINKKFKTESNQNGVDRPTHRRIVTEALEAGKTVPAEALAAYPDLREKYQSTNDNTQSTANTRIPNKGTSAPKEGTPQPTTKEVKTNEKADEAQGDAQRNAAQGDALQEGQVAAAPPPAGVGAAKPAEVAKEETPAKVSAAPAAKKPLRMDGTTRPEKAKPAPTPEFTALHPKSQEKFNAAWEAQDAAAMSELVHLENRGLRAEFESRSGEKLPKTVKGTDEAVAAYFAKETPDVPLEPDSAVGEKPEAAGGVAEKAAVIEDLGEKIGGARKDLSIARGGRVSAPKENTGWRAKFRISQMVVDATVDGSGNLKDNPNKGKWAIYENTGKQDRWNMPRPLGRQYFDTKEEAEAMLPALAVAVKHSIRTTGDKLSIYRRIGDRKLVRVIPQEFDTREDAMRYLVENAEDILTTKLNFGEEILPKPETVTRTGALRRNGNVAGQDFMDALGFRAVEFGNWVSKTEDRQEVMNYAYDSLLDMADALGIPPKAVSLNGELALAFGARGHGLSGAAAHYEPGYAVINLTKMAGAGHLAHEWFHAFDHYLGRLDTKASSVKEKNDRGDAVYPDQATSDFFASHGFSYGDKSKARQELREAFTSFAKTMANKAQTFVEDTKQADRFVSKAREELAARLKDVRDNLAKQLDPKYYKRKNTPATDAQLSRYDQLAKMLIDGESTEIEYRFKDKKGPVRRGSLSVTGRYTNDILEEMGEIYKDVRGRSGFADKVGDNSIGKLAGPIRAYRERIRMLKDAEGAVEKVKSVPTEFRMQAKAADQARSKDYWSTEHELAARAFAAYLEDKLATLDANNDFLVYHAHGAILAPVYPEGLFRPYPEGKERAAINDAFDHLFSTIETRETDKGVALFSKTQASPTGLPSDTVSASVRKVIDGWKNAPPVKVIASIKELPEHIKKYVASDSGSGDIKGVYDPKTGTIYLIADALDTLERAHFVLAHEALGHYGLRGMLGDKINPILNQVYLAKVKEAKAIARQYGLDTTDPADRRLAAEEVLANMAAEGQSVGFVKRAIAALREWLRGHGFKVKWSENDLRALVANAGRYVTHGEGGKFAGTRPRFTTKGTQDGAGTQPRAEDHEAVASLRKALQSQAGGNARVDLAAVAPTSRQAAELAAEVAGIWGKRVTFVKGEVVGHGVFWGGTPDRVFINSEVSDSDALLLNLGHELLHSLKNDNEALYQKLLGRLAPNIKNFDAYEKARAEYYPSEDASEELVAELSGEQFTDPEFWRKLKREEPTLAAKVVRIVKALLAKVSLHTDHFTTDVDSVQDAIAEVFGEYAKGAAKFSRKQTQTPAFRAWFGDSKVVDSEGAPLVVYHGTAADFSEFKASNSYDGAIFFSSSYEVAEDRAGEDNAKVLSVYLAPQNLFDVDSRTDIEAATPWIKNNWSKIAQNYEDALKEVENGNYPAFEGTGLIPHLRSLGYDGFTTYEGAKNYAVFSPTQIKSAVGNNGDFSPANPDIRFKRKDSALDDAIAKFAGGETQRAVQSHPAVQSFIGSLFTSGGRQVSLWQRTVGTMYHLGESLEAKGMPEFKRVYNKGQDFLSDISTFAIRAESLAPGLFPKMGAGKGLFKGLKKEDAQAIAGPLFQGTLDGGPNPFKGKTWMDAELKDRHGLNDKQVGLYHEARAAANQSLDDVARSFVAKYAKQAERDFNRNQSLADMAKEVGDSLQEIVDEAQAELDATKEAFEQIEQPTAQQKKEFASAERQALAVIDLNTARKEGVEKLAKDTAQLKKAGYFPLSRFGEYTVTMRDSEGATEFFGMYESKGQAFRAMQQLKSANPQNVVTQGVMSKEKFKLYGGLSMEAVELFAEHMSAEESAPYQEYLKKSLNNRSALKKMIERKGTAGYNEDAVRTLANFIVSNARHASTQYHLNDMRKLAEAIDEEDQGDVKDQAVKLWEYLTKPAEEAAKLRGYLFFHYLGGSLASGLVNMTQPVMMTAPYLAQKVSAAKTMKYLISASKRSFNNLDSFTGDLGVALRRAEEEGVTAPQEIHQLTAMATNKLFASNPAVNAGLKAWGSLFATAEVFNRRTTFIAAFEIATERGENAYDEAVKAVTETQGIYNKGNRPNFGRGMVGSTLFTFKQFTVMYLELFKRLPTKQRLLMMGILLMASGLEGLPFADDMEDLIDTLMQWAGYSWNTGAEVKQGAQALLGEMGSELVLKGISAVLPFDIHNRLGMQNLIPGTGVLKQSTNDKGRDVQDFFGPAGGLLSSLSNALTLTAQGLPGRGALAAMPRAVQNAAQGVEMAVSGSGHDRYGRTTVPVSVPEAITKAIGFNPSRIAKESDIKGEQMQDINLLRVKKTAILNQWVNGILTKDENEIAKAREKMQDWNEKNPQLAIRITPQSLRAKILAARATSKQRFLKSVPKEQRRRMIDELE